MSSPAERKRIREKIWKSIIPVCSNGNKEAEAYLKRIFFIVRMIDDLNDGDHPVDHADIIKGFFLLLADIPNNTFYRDHSATLMGVHIISFNAWQDSNRWEKTKDGLKRIYAHVLRDYVCELFILVAYLTGGEKSMKAVSLKVRQTFLKEPKNRL